jgi:hypothetical protein
VNACSRILLKQAAKRNSGRVTGLHHTWLACAAEQR